MKNIKNESESLQQSQQDLKIYKVKGDCVNPFGIILPRRKRLKARDVLSIHSQLIRNFIAGEIVSQEAKDLSYLCTNYLNALQHAETEKRLQEIEEKINAQT